MLIMLSKSKIRKIVLLVLLFWYSVELAQAGSEGEIEDLCAGGGVVQLDGKTYIISESFELPSNLELIGTDGTVLIFADNCRIPQNVPMISIKNQKNITIRNIRFEGNQKAQTYALSIPNPNHPEQTGKKAWGNQVNTFIYAINSEGITVTNCAFNDNLGDGLRVSGCKNIEFAYNTGEMGGHDTFFALRSEGIRVHHNEIHTLVNSAIRCLSVSHVRIFNNFIDWKGPRDAGPGLQIQNDGTVMTDIEVCNNVIVSSWGPGLWLVDKTGGNSEIWLHHNLFLYCGGNHGIWWVSGIISSGYDNALIENNVFDGCYQAGITYFAVNNGWATEATATLNANIFTESVPGKRDGSGGYGVQNKISKQSVISKNNCYWNNKAGDVSGCSVSDSDLFIDPKTHETPSGWWWTGSEWQCEEVKPSEMGDIEGLYNGMEPMTEEEIEEFEFNSIFDVLEMKFTDSGRTDQTAEDVPLQVAEKSSGIIAGGVKIVGFKDRIVIDNVSYIPDDQAVMAQTKVIQNPDFSQWTGIIKQIDKDISVKIENGTAYAKLTVKTHWYTKSKNSLTGKSTKSKIKTSTATFKDSFFPAPEILTRPTEKTGYINEYRSKSTPNTRVYVDPEGLQKIVYEYKGNTSTHTFLIGERLTDEAGVYYTVYTRADSWSGQLSGLDNSFIIYGPFDPEKLKVICYTPYENFTIEEWKHNIYELEKKAWVTQQTEFILKFLLMLFCGYKLMRIIIPP